MRSAFALFDRDGDGTINSKVSNLVKLGGWIISLMRGEPSNQFSHQNINSAFPSVLKICTGARSGDEDNGAPSQ